MGATRLELVTPSVSSKGVSDVSRFQQQFASVPLAVCTPVCTGTPGTANADPLEALAATLLGLSPADRARLAALLLGQQAGNGEGSR